MGRSGLDLLLNGGDDPIDIEHVLTAQWTAFIDEEGAVFGHLPGIAVAAWTVQLLRHLQESIPHLREIGILYKEWFQGLQFGEISGFLFVQEREFTRGVAGVRENVGIARGQAGLSERFAQFV